MTRPRGSPGLAALSGVLVVAEGAFAAIGLLVWNAHRHGNLTGAEAATFTLLGAAAAFGAVIMLVAAVALLRGARGRRAAGIASVLAWIRLAGVLIALMAVAVLLGGGAVIGGFETFGAALTLVDAVIGLIVIGTAVRRTRL